MKRITLLLISLLTLCSGCDRIKEWIEPDTTQVVCIGDPTDPLLKNPDADEVLKIFHIDDDSHLYNGMSLTYKSIGSVAMIPDRTLKVASVNPLLSSSEDRVSQIKEFKENVRRTFEDAQKHAIPMTKSCIYKVLVMQANILSRSSSKHKYLLIYSNCLDNDATLNLYNFLIREQVQNNPMAVIASLNKIMKLEDMTGVRVLIIYQSSSPKDEELFMTAANFYKTLFTNAHAECQVVASLETTDVYEKK